MKGVVHGKTRVASNQSLTVPPALEMRGISKRFPGVVALDRVDFSVRGGEIHSLIGQNGAGKSTLMNILSGVYPPDEGQILIDGKAVTIGHPREALRRGIGTVYQELSLLPNLSVADNIFLGREAGNGFVIDERVIVDRARAVLDLLGETAIDVTARARNLPLAQQQIVEIAKVLSHEPRILILDEPTAPLAAEETRRLFAILHELKTRGLAIIFISHRFQEIVAHCDRGTILRNGRLVLTLPLAGVTEEELAERMIGQQVEGCYRTEDQTRPDSAEVLLEVNGLSVGDRVHDVSFALRRGEIIGVTGLLGAGQNELARALFGIAPKAAGTIRRRGREVRIGSPAEAIDQGICLLTEHRKQEGLFPDLSVKENMTLPSLGVFRRGGVFLDNGRERDAVRRFIDALHIVVRSAGSRVRTLSGGNQQKVILARWLMRDLEVLIFIEPTRGIDVGAKAEIYGDLVRLAGEGKGIIVVSTELPEILGLSDRILVMHGGRLARVVEREAATEEGLLATIQGGHADGV
ncbi:MAG: sugar ABC transporter ATP-binding protein [Chloroflexi bacterium]|nr:sugar ABC transporter ATP-binding protein [Chloroflexota bacterium]